MLSPSMVQWWFEPWSYAPGAATVCGLASDRFGLRDGYRFWCGSNAVEERIPERFDPAWSVAACTGEAELADTARLFGGLSAARDQDLRLLGKLAPADRKWCLGIAATQPLRSSREVRYAPDDGLDVRGLIELARRLESGFPGMWSRLRLLLPAQQAARVAVLLPAALAGKDDLEPAPARAQRCWQMCRNRAHAAATPEQMRRSA